MGARRDASALELGDHRLERLHAVDPTLREHDLHLADPEVKLQSLRFFASWGPALGAALPKPERVLLYRRATKRRRFTRRSASPFTCEPQTRA